MKKFNRKFMAVIVAIAMAMTILPTNVFAADLSSNEDILISELNADVETGAYANGTFTTLSTFGTGDHYVGATTVNDKHWGGYHVFNAKRIKVKPAWKATDSTTSEIDMYIALYDVTLGQTIYKHRFTPSEDIDGKDSKGYWYYEDLWYAITPGHTYQFYYEAFTTPGYSGTGSNRIGTCSLWINLANALD